MKYLLLTLAVLGVVVSSLALHEHYRTYGDSPCSINERWDCGVVNHSQYAMLAGTPVAAIGIAGYILMGALAFFRSVLGVWCVYCAISLGIISLMSLLTLGTVVAQVLRKPKPA